MKTTKLKSSFLAAVCALLALFPWLHSIKNQDLSDITQPHLGTYECRLAQLDSQNLLEDFSYIRLELKKKNECVLHYCPKKGSEKTEKGEYIYNKERQTVSFSLQKMPFIKREFPMKHGVIYITLSQGDRTLLMQFHQT